MYVYTEVQVQSQNLNANKQIAFLKVRFFKHTYTTHLSWNMPC